MPTLSPFFMNGYIASYRMLCGGQTESFFAIGSRFLAPNRLEYRPWSYPLALYLHHYGHDQRRALAYELTRILARGMAFVYANDRLVARDLATIGYWWFRGRPLLSSPPTPYALARHCVPLIAQAIDQHPTASAYARARIALDTFVAFAHSAGEIPLSVAYDNHFVHLTLTECPFCDHAPYCTVLHGMIHGLLDTLHGRALRETPPEHGDLFFAAEQPDPHHIVLQFADALMRWERTGLRTAW